LFVPKGLVNPEGKPCEYSAVDDLMYLSERLKQSPGDWEWERDLDWEGMEFVYTPDSYDELIRAKFASGYPSV